MEEDSYMEDEDEVDEEMEAMLYSQVHYELDSSVGREMATAQKHLNPECQHIFTVTPLKEEHSSMSLKHSVISAAASVKQQPLVESAFSDSEDPTEVGESFDKARRVVADTRIDSVVQTDSSVPGQTADVIYTDSQKGVPDDQHQVRFDMEAELGINVSPKAKKGNKTKNDEDTSVHTFSTSKPKFSGTDATFSTPEFIKIDKHAPQTEQDYRKTLNRLLTSHSRLKKEKDIVVVQSDSASSSSSSSSNLSDDESGNSDSSSKSSSESDTGIFGSTPADESAEVPTLDLNWNISADDRETVERIEKRASQVDESKWKVSDEDLILGGPMVSRYYSKKQVRCHNCDKEGHLSKVCPEARKRPVCGLCGTEGHIMKRCKNNLCFNCNQPGHRGRACPQPKRKCFARCSRCHFKGHNEKHCPDLWRQYHLTITSSEDLTWSLREVNPRRFCCNCAKPGHFAHECRNARMDNYNFPPSPFVIRYDALPNEPRKDNEQGSGRKFKSRKRKGSPSLTKQGESVDSPPSSKKPYRPGSKDKGAKQKAKNFKSDHLHSGTPQQSEGNKMYPRGSQNSFSDPGSQQFSAQTSTFSSPYEHTPSGSNMNSSLEKGAQEVHTAKTYPYQQGGTPGRPAYSETFGQPMLPKDDSRNIDHQSEQRRMDNYSDSHKKKNARRRKYRNKKRLERSSRTKDGGTVDSLPLSETPFQLKSTVGITQHKHEVKKFKSDHCHISASQQSHENQIYPYGYPESVDEVGSQQYFNAQTGPPQQSQENQIYPCGCPESVDEVGSQQYFNAQTCAPQQSQENQIYPCGYTESVDEVGSQRYLNAQIYAPQQSQGNQMYQCGCPSSVSQLGSQQYLNAQTSTHFTPPQHTLSNDSYMNRSQKKGRQRYMNTSQKKGRQRYMNTSQKKGRQRYMNTSQKKGRQTGHITYKSQGLQSGASGRQVYTRAFLLSVLPEDKIPNTLLESEEWGRYSHFNGQGQRKSHWHWKSRNRVRSSKTRGVGNVDSLPPSETLSDQRTDDKPREKSDQDQMEGWKKPRKQKRKTKGESSHQHRAFKPHDSDRQKAKKQWKQKQRKESKASVSQSSASAKGMESLTITCRNGFRTTVKTMNFNRDCHNALH